MGEWLTNHFNSENSRRLWPFLFWGSQGNSGKVAGKLLDIFLNRKNATNSGILGTGKGKPAENLGVDTVQDVVPTFCAGVFAINNRAKLPETLYLELQQALWWAVAAICRPPSPNTLQATQTMIQKWLSGIDRQWPPIDKTKVGRVRALMDTNGHWCYHAN